MDFFKRSWAQIRATAEGLSVSQKWAISTTLVLGLLLVAMAVIIAGQPEMVPISPFASGQSQIVLARLQSAGIDARSEAGQIVVPATQEDRAILLLVQGDLLNTNAAEAFNELIARQSLWQTDRQNEQAYLLAKQDVLGKIIAKMRGVRSASVLIAVPQDKGFGSTYTRPSASVSIWMEGSTRVSDTMVDSVARLVAGAVAEMQPQDVSITDANHGRTRTVKDEDDVLPTETLDLVHKLESYHREKIGTVLSYIPGVIVAVHVQVDPVNQHVEEWDYAKTEPLASEEIEEITRSELRNGGEPGPQSNVGLTIAGGGGEGMREAINRTRTEFGEKQLVKRVQSTQRQQKVQQINVTINVPRRYFVQIYKGQNAGTDTDAPPNDAALQSIMDAQLTKIEAQVKPLIMAEASGLVQAHMIPDDTLLPAAVGPAATAGVGSLLTSGWTKPVGMAVLGLAPLMFMLWMVRKATQQDPMPSVEELAGVPPMLPEDEDLIGEAESGDAPMAGVELNDDELKTRKIAEQISSLIKANPAEAGNLLGRWVKRES